MSREERIRDLEHDTLWPLGEHPAHCDQCRAEAERRIRQAELDAETARLRATCTHPSEYVDRIDITCLGSPRQMMIVQCRRCGSELDDDQ